ncbi:MAG: DUF3367 domain-containing protein [Acidimicrobiales bacterium]|nr:DUF3367 domain-containing protein [Acidimicrobiales bacterium]
MTDVPLRRDEPEDDLVERDGGRLPHPSGSWWPLVPVALLAYVPFLATRPGLISADTKSYLYLDPGRLLSRAWSMWDPNVGLGTVSHQTIGYLWPMGPWFWFFDLIGVPDWVAQRLWWGTLVFAATSGAAYLFRRFELPAVALWPAAVAFGLSPYAVAYLGRLSGVLLPAVGLPWLLAFTIQATRSKGWRYPALFALTVTTVGSVNLTALALVGIGPLTWIIFVVVSGRVRWSEALAVVGRIGALTLPTSAWWLAGLSVQATNGIDIVRYSETAEVVARTSIALEVLRGLGYWFFYGGDKVELWIEPSFQYTKRRIIYLGTFALPWLAMLSGAVSRWRHRTYFVMLLVVGVVVSVGANPWQDPSPVGAAIKWFLGTDRGLAFRSLPRAVPLVALASAALIGGLLSGLRDRKPVVARVSAVAVLVAAVFGMVPMWQRSIVQDGLARSTVPGYWKEAARVLDERDDGTRVLAVPGSDFASYRWGNTVDPILPGLMDRPFVARELVPYGTPPSADLLNDFDLPIQERTLQPQAIAPVARLMRVGDILVRSDLQYERYNLARPRLVWELFRDAPGLGTPIELSGPWVNQPLERLQMHDEVWLSRELGLPDPPVAAIIPVTDSRPIYDVKPADGAVLLSGDGAGIVDAATARRIDGNELIRYSGSLDAAEIEAELRRGASLVVTDTNRKRGERWGTLRHTRGQTEQADEPKLEEDLTDNRLPRFEGRGSDVQTVTVQRGGIRAFATSYGNPITFVADARPALAVDGNPDTQWATAAFTDARGERLVLALDEPLSFDHLTLQQLPVSRTTRAITKVRLDFGDGRPLEVSLGKVSRTSPGQRIDVGTRRTSKVTITIVADSLGNPVLYGDVGPVGFAEVRLGDDPPHVDETVRMPTDLVDAVSRSRGRARAARLTYVLTRVRQDATDRTRDDDERAMARTFRVPGARGFTLKGVARISPRADDAVIDELLGTTSSELVSVVSNHRLDGSRTDRASAALDGNPKTAWTSRFVRPAGSTITVTTRSKRSFDRLDLRVVSDLAHSTPKTVEVAVDGRVVTRRELQSIEPGALGTTTRVPITFPSTEGRRLTVKVTAVHKVTSFDWNSNDPVAHPIAIAELGVPGLRVDAAPTRFDDRCRSDILTLDGKPLPVSISGSSVDAQAGRPLDVKLCDSDAVRLTAGDHELDARAGVDNGLDIDQLVIDSSGTGGAGSTRGSGGTTDSVPRVEVSHEGRDSSTMRISGLEPGKPVWVILGQSFSDGWKATVEGGPDLGAPKLVDGFANGWFVTPESSSIVVRTEFVPQKRVDIALVLSALALVVTLFLALRRPSVAGPVDAADGSVALDAGQPTGLRTGVVVAIATAAVVFLVSTPIVAVGIGVAAGLASVRSGWRRFMHLLPAALLMASVAVALWIDVRDDVPAGIEWVTTIEPAHPVAMAAVCALAADQVVDLLWRRRRRRDGSEDSRLPEEE